MRETLDLDHSRLALDFADRAELDGALERAREQGFTVRLEARLEPGVELELVLRFAATELVFPIRVKQVFRSGRDRHGTILEVLDWTAADAYQAASAAPAGADSELTRASATEAEATTSPVSEVTGASLVFELRQLNAAERIRLASKANRNERQILLRDSAPSVAMALLSNPQIELKEVLEIVKNPQAASGVLQRVAQDRRFSGNYEIQLALARNPQTPSPIAVRLIEGLRTGDLRDLAKSQALRENIRAAALRTYLKRSS